MPSQSDEYEYLSLENVIGAIAAKVLGKLKAKLFPIKRSDSSFVPTNA